jgi:cell wall-associated NlpC family hydrolase
MHARSLVRFSLPLMFVLTGVLRAAEPAPADSALADPDPATRPAEVRRGVELRGSREERSRRVYEAAIRKVEPTLVGDPSRLGMYVELFKREFVEDPRTFAINLSATADADKRVTTSGWIEFQEHRKALGEFLKHLGFAVASDGVELLPDAKLGDERFAIATGDACFLYDKPAGLRETFTQCVPGDPLFVLKDVGDGILLCHAGDGYVGFVAASQLRRVSGEAFDAHLRSRPSSAEREARIERAIATATKLLGTKYVWGGRTSAGIDCSGLVHESYRAAGVNLPRDADQQSLAGTLVATRWHRSSLQRGDVLFFLGGRGTISHTALYIGDGTYLEAVAPVARISTFDEVIPGRDRRRGENFCFAKRVLE